MGNLSFLLILLLNFEATVLSVDEFSRYDFPPGFVFGSGTSAYQVEGAANEDGRTPSIWDTYAHAGNAGGFNGDVACDGYHKYKEDVQLMVDTGLEAYRFSISWSRLIPNGRGPVNPKGLQYYNNLINELIDHGIVPHVTLHNYDLPQALEDEYGGWVNRKIVNDFTAYADVCFREFGDRVAYWTTVNEPNVFAVGSYDQGIAPPKHCSPPFGTNCTKGNSSTEPYLAAHHLLLSHASAVTLYRKKYQGKQNGFIGLSVFAYGVAPFTNSTEDALAAQRFNDFLIGWVMHPLVFGDYPSIMRQNVGSRLPIFTRDEAKDVTGSFDFIGLIYYFKLYVKDNPNSLKLTNRDYNLDAAIELAFKLDGDTSADEFPIDDPSSMQMILEYFKLVYGNPPIFIYENGKATSRGSSLEDTSRVRYLQTHIGSLLDALRNGSNAVGYFTWSFMDVFELLDGYEKSFGLYYVDFDDLDRKRYAKLSAYWYSHFLKGRNVTFDLIIELQKNFPGLYRY